jgi:hypothetical protein
MASRAPPPSEDDPARALAVRLSQFFLQNGWNAVADPSRDRQGQATVEIRSAEPLDPIPGRYALHRARFVVESARLEAQFQELTGLLQAARRGTPSPAPFTTRPVLPEWCRTD